jgi:NADPH-dependent ferric siderophore reductase
VRVAAPTPAMARITLSAPAFADFGVTEPGEIITLGWAPDGDELVLPQLGWRFPDGKPEQHWRNFSVRSHDPGAATLDVDFYLHGDAGIAAAWALRAAPGDRVGFAGPRVHWAPREEATWSLLVADETGLPALLAILETLPDGHRSIALIEVADDGERQPVEPACEADVRWVTRGARPPGGTTVLADALREVELPHGPGQVWGGGESKVMRAVREHVRAERELPRGTVQALGYWKYDDDADWEDDEE